MKRFPLLMCAMARVLLAAPMADAQMPNSLVGGSRFNPPPPSPFPAPNIEAPAVPKMDAPLRYDYRPAPRPSRSATGSRVVSMRARAPACVRAGVRPIREAAPIGSARCRGLRDVRYAPMATNFCNVGASF
jgi:hypothetical protein